MTKGQKMFNQTLHRKRGILIYVTTLFYF